jgi:sterol desaturase/sphingolipid hydroxylase (fatty acid hydroxylase superfamily)
MDEAVARSRDPIRLFKSDFLEFFSHISPIAVLVVWVPVTAFFLYGAAKQAAATGPVPLVVGLAIGWFVWTLTEYTLHRFLFHHHPATERFKRIFFVMHGVHHAQPMCRTRLVMPPPVSIPLALVFYGVFDLVFSLLNAPAWFDPVFAGFIAGYIAYDMVHYTLHHSRTRNGYIAMCRYQHMQHHGTCPNMRFGVSVPLWDYVFGTMPAEGLLKKKAT